VVFLQPPLPSHLPLKPQVLFSFAHVSVSGESLGTLAHVPSEPGTAQLVHTMVHDVAEQQTPSTQLPEMQSVPTAQTMPRPFLPQVWLDVSHMPTAQSASTVQDTLHVPAWTSHLMLPQLVVVSAGQACRLVHFSSLIAVTPVQDLSRQMVLVSQKRQAPAPSQKPSVPQVLFAVIVHGCRGSAMLLANGLHVPSDPGTLHDLHWPVQASAQQRPSTQKFEAQSAGNVHIAPSGPRPHLAATHLLGARQGELSMPTQEVKQALVAASQT
jgi:hypothetical protein